MYTIQKMQRQNHRYREQASLLQKHAVPELLDTPDPHGDIFLQLNRPLLFR